jgi:hypothetical protein
MTAPRRPTAAPDLSPPLRRASHPAAPPDAPARDGACEALPTTLAWLAGDVPDDGPVAHIAGCAVCQAAVEAEERVLSALADAPAALAWTPAEAPSAALPAPALRGASWPRSAAGVLAGLAALAAAVALWWGPAAPVADAPPPPTAVADAAPTPVPAPRAPVAAAAAEPFEDAVDDRLAALEAEVTALTADLDLL